MDIGRRLKQARQAIGYTLEKVSDFTGIGQSSLSEFENSRREPKFSQLSVLAELYRKPIEFFLTDAPISHSIMLWRDPPSKDKKKEYEVKFEQLCQQYRRLEILMDKEKEVELPRLNVKSEDFKYIHAEQLASEAQKRFSLGEIPSTSLKQVLEEKFYIKIFHLDFDGSAISTISDVFGPAILLNKDSKLWRRNFDLAHELFHLLTWNIFRTEGSESVKPTENEEKLASAFASRLLLPTDTVKNKIEAIADEKGRITFEALDEIAREFGVSIDALLWRLHYLYRVKPEKVEQYISQAAHVKRILPPRESDKPDELPERYCSLAIRALNAGRLSLIQFAKYMGISYKKAQEYLTEEGAFKDEEVSIPAA